MVGRRTCDQEVASSIPGQGAAAKRLWASCSHPRASTYIESLNWVYLYFFATNLNIVVREEQTGGSS